MFKGTVVAIHIAPDAAGKMVPVKEARAVPGKGLEGDRYFLQRGTFSKPAPDREVTLIEIEAIEALNRDYRVALDAGDSRRNIATRGVPLNQLVGPPDVPPLKPANVATSWLAVYVLVPTTTVVVMVWLWVGSIVVPWATSTLGSANG